MSSIVRLRINAVETLQKNIESKEAALTRDRNELAVRTKLLQQEIEKGGTTGDPLTDLVLKAGGAHNDPALPKLRELAARLKARVGEFVAIRYSDERRLRYGGDIRSGDFEALEWVRIGVLKDETLWVRDRGSHKALTLPVEEYLGGTWAYSAWTVTLEEKPEKADFFEWGSDDQPPTFIQFVTDAECAKRLMIGDEAVRAELKGVHAEEFFPLAARRLNRLILEPTA